MEISIGSRLRDGEGIVKFQIGLEYFEITVRQARDIASLLLEAADATIIDEAVFQYYKSIGDLELGQRVINAIRTKRHAEDRRWIED